MRIGRKLAITAALTLGSGLVAAKGTAEQHDCFNGLQNDYGVESLSDIPEKIQNDSGCVNWLNTLGSAGVALGLGTGATMVVLDRRKKRAAEAAPAEPEVPEEPVAPAIESRKRLDKVLPAQCLGSKCVNYSGVACNAREELLRADGETGHEEPPEIDDPTLTYAMYGTVCGNNTEELAAVRFTFFEEDPNLAKAVALSGMYGDLPVTITTPSSQLGVGTVASSDTPPVEG